MILFKNYWLMACMLLSLMFVLSSCDDDDGDINIPANEVKFENIALTGAAEVQDPPVSTTGSGTLNAVYNEDTKKISYTINWTLGSSTDKTVGMHLHGPATTTENASIIIGIPLSSTGTGDYDGGGSDSGTGTVSGQTRALTEAEEEQLLGGLWYLNVHSTTYPNGELRGQLVQ
jgi:hypothetical protein